MNAEQLLQHFERISEAPDAIKRLRRFILDLAVRGKLVEQDPSEEPASELVKRITAEKVMLVKAGEIKKQKPLGALPESPFPIPSNWCWSQLAEIGVLSPRNEAPDTLEVSFVPMPLIAADYGVANQHEIRPWAEIKKGYTHFAEGDVGLAKITPCFENGKSSVFRNLTGGLGSGTTELYIVRPLFVNQDYILLFLKSPHFIETGIPKMTGTAGQKRVPTNYFSNSPFPLPPLAEQHRIVAKADELMSLCDQLDAAKAEREKCRDSLVAASLQGLNQPAEEEETFREHARFTFNNLPQITTRAAHIKQLRQTILNLAVRGKLVEQDPSDEPASELLKRIATEKARAGGRNKELTPIEESEISHAAPESWAWTRMGNVFSIRTGFAFKSSTYTKTGTLVFRVTNFDRDGSFDLADSVFFPTDKIDAKMSGFLLKPDEIIMVMVGGTIGKTTIVDASILPALLNQNMWRIRSHGGLLLSRYEYLLIKNINHSVHGLTQSTHGHFAMSDYEKRVFPLPPLAEQHRIVAKVDELIAICDQLEAQITATEQDSRRFLESVLADALAPGIECNHH
jgi:type I restriction enzyme, S subunit